MRKRQATAEELRRALERFPDLPANTQSTATGEDCRRAISLVIDWWNDAVLPTLYEGCTSARKECQP